LIALSLKELFFALSLPFSTSYPQFYPNKIGTHPSGLARCESLRTCYNRNVFKELMEINTFRNVILILTAWGGAFLAALWLSLVIWTYRDIRQRTRDRLARILAILVVTVLFLPGLVIYWILRPPRTLEDEYQQTLEEEALLQSIEEAVLCPGCGRKVEADWMVCPSCHTKLRKQCHQCQRLLELSWNICPYCATPVIGMRKEEKDL